MIIKNIKKIYNNLKNVTGFEKMITKKWDIKIWFFRNFSECA
jgi:hypothetical protein